MRIVFFFVKTVHKKTEFLMNNSSKSGRHFQIFMTMVMQVIHVHLMLSLLFTVASSVSVSLYCVL